MNDLSFTQEYFLCAVNKKGDLPILSSDAICCLVAGGIMELTQRGYIAIDDKKMITISKSWDDSLSYLKPLYDTIDSFKKSKKTEAVLEAFAMSFTDKKIKELVAAFRTSLMAASCLDEQSAPGMLKEKTNYIPKPELVTRIIEKVRAEFLEEGSISDDVICLSVLLVEGNLIKNYFSKVETAKMKARVKEIRNSDAYASVKHLFDYMDAVAAIVIIIAAN